ncbi:MAG: DUF4956 domain-containing protein [Clostridiales bacterium]|nr:DUF4956 domain-containing protein [Clostridiales bacterium]
MLSTFEFTEYIIISLGLGVIIALSYGVKDKPSRSFAATLTLLPALVAVVIMMVNGSVGAGVAVAGTFSLVRFRSAPGTAKEIAAVFLSMATGIICGMGYFLYAALFTAIICAAMIILKITGFGRSSNEKDLLVSIPESLNYEEVFEDIFNTYTTDRKLIYVKTSDMGSIFRLKYKFSLKPGAGEKEFIDKLRVRNGNLPVTICEASTQDPSAQL